MPHLSSVAERLSPNSPALQCRVQPVGAVLCFLPLFTILTPARAAVPVPRPVTPAQMHKIVASHKGHVVLVNFWATWCDTCREEFPALVQTAHKYKSAGLVTLTVSADPPIAVKSKVLPFLAGQNADWPQYVQQGANVTRWAALFDPTWSPAAYPRTFVYDRRGKLVKTLDTPQTAAGFAAAVRPFLVRHL